MAGNAGRLSMTPGTIKFRAKIWAGGNSSAQWYLDGYGITSAQHGTTDAEIILDLLQVATTQYDAKANQELHRGNSSIVSKVAVHGNKKAFVLKKDVKDRKNGVSSLKHEFDIIDNLAQHGVTSTVRPVAWGIVKDGSNERYAILEEYLGATLEDYIKQHHDKPEMRDIGRSLEMALSISKAALELNLLFDANKSDAKTTVHRDLKPSNIACHDDRNGNLSFKLIDFGTACSACYEERRNPSYETAISLGTPPYMAPERIALDDVDREKLKNNNRKLYEYAFYENDGSRAGRDSTVDVYGIGVILLMLCVVTTRHPNTAQTKNSYLTQYNFEDQARQFDKGGYGIDAFDTYCKSRPAVNTLDSRIYNVFGDGDKGRPRKGQRAIQLLIDSATNVDRRERPGIEDFTTLLQIFDEQYRQHQDQENQTGDFDDEGFYEEAKGWIEASASSSSLYSSDFCRRKQTLIKYLMSNLGTSPSSETDLLTTHAETVQSTMEGAPKSLREAQAEAVRTPNQHKPVRKPKRPAAHERSEGVFFDITVCCLLLLVLLFAINQPTRVWWLRWLPLPSIQFEVAQSKLYGENGQALDYEEAFKELKALADTGYQPARQVVADCLDNGIGTDINHDKAEDYREAIKTFGTPEMSINPEGNQ